MFLVVPPLNSICHFCFRGHHSVSLLTTVVSLLSFRFVSFRFVSFRFVSFLTRGAIAFVYDLINDASRNVREHSVQFREHSVQFREHSVQFRERFVPQSEEREGDDKRRHQH